MSVQIGAGKQILFTMILLLIAFLIIEGIAQILLLEIQDKCKSQTTKVYYNEYSKELVERLCADLKNLKYLDSTIRTNFPNQSTLTYSINEHGFRGESIDLVKPADEYRIIMVGGSTTFGLGSTADEHTIPAYLESILNEKFEKNIQVINAGVIAAAARSEVYYIENSLIKFDPDLIIIFDGYNDSFNINLSDINPDDEYVSNINISPLELFVKDNLQIFATPKVIFQYTYDYFQSQSLTDDVMHKNTEKWVERWNKTCKLANEKNFELFVIVQPMLGTSDRTLSEIESDIRSSNVQYDKTFKFLNDLGDNIDSLSCPHADLRHTFDGIDEQVFHSQVHTGDKQNKIIANTISENIKYIIQKDM